MLKTFGGAEFLGGYTMRIGFEGMLLYFTGGKGWESGCIIVGWLCWFVRVGRKQIDNGYCGWFSLTVDDIVVREATFGE